MRRANRFAALLSLSIAFVVTSGCSGSKFPEAKRTPLVLATTTSAEDSGILAEFVKRFEKDYPYKVKAVAVGSGAALFMGRNGDADVMLTHEPMAEREFMAAGYGESSNKVMHNDFVVAGPASDPAGIRGLEDADEAFRRIAAKGALFVSRADASGTNAMELSVWDRIGAKPTADSYMDTGSSMGETLRVADEKSAYTLTDRATFIVMKDALDMKLLAQGDPRLVNQYTVTVVNPERFSRVNHDGAVAFSEFLRTPETKKLIRDYGWDQYREHLFYPD